MGSAPKVVDLWKDEAWFDRGLQLLGKHQIVVSLVVAFLTGYGGLQTGLAVEGATLESFWTDRDRIWSLSWGGLWIGVATCIQLGSTIKARRELNRRETLKILSHSLELAARSAGHPEAQLRASYSFLTQVSDLDGRREEKRRVHRATSLNFSADDADVDLTMHALGGLSGRVFESGRPQIFVVAETPDPARLMSQAEKNLVRPTLKTVLCVPINHPDEPGSRERRIGTLQVDSDLDVVQLGWDLQTVTMAQMCADMTALHLRG